MNEPQRVFALGTLLAAVGMWLLLPRGGMRGRLLGVVLATSAVGFWASKLPRLGHWLDESALFGLAAVTIVSAVAAVSLANPVYCAIWFGMSLLGVAGLFLYQGSQFLAVATIVVYAGAILVTFLFVLMLASPRGRAHYDRVSWEGFVSAAAGAVMMGVLSTLVYNALGRAAHEVVPRATAEELHRNVLHSEHVARLGTELFGRHLLSVEVVGVLLMAALVGSAAIVASARTSPVGAHPPAPNNSGEGGDSSKPSERAPQ